MDNPIRSLRMAVGLSQGDLIRFSGVNRMVVLRTEQGLYSSPSRKITDVLVMFNPTLTHELICEMYSSSQNYTRSEQAWWIKRVPVPPVADLQKHHPFVQFRNTYAPTVFKSRMGFCKAFCIHPNSMRLFETGEQIIPPESLLVGLRLAGFPPAGLAWVTDSALRWAQQREVL